MRRAAKIDANQNALVDALRAGGASAFITSAVGNGFTDLVVGYCGGTFLIEVKNGNLPPSRRRLTPAQEKFHREWTGGPILLFETLEDVAAFLRDWNC